MSAIALPAFETLVPAFKASSNPAARGGSLRRRNSLESALESERAAISQYPRIRELLTQTTTPVPALPDLVTPWHTWELLALFVGVVPELAELGRRTFSRADAEGWDIEGHRGFADAEHLLNLAFTRPDQMYWDWLQLSTRFGGLPGLEG